MCKSRKWKQTQHLWLAEKSQVCQHFDVLDFQPPELVKTVIFKPPQYSVINVLVS